MTESPQRHTADYSENGLRVRLLGALAAIAAVTVLAQVALQWSLSGAQDDAHVVNVAGRQRMLSQQIAKTAYRLIGVGTTEARRSAQDELRDAVAQFQRAHLALQQGDADQGLPGAGSIQIGRLFAAIEPEYQSMVDAASRVLAASDRPGEIHQAVQRLSEQEASFLRGMDEIVRQYDADARRRILRARWLAFGFAVVTLAALAFLARRMLEPAMTRLHRDMQEHERLAMEMENLFAATPTALFQIDAASLAILRGNRKAEKMMGCSREEFVGRPFSIYFDGRLEINKHFVLRLRAGKPFDEQAVLLIDARHNAIEARASLRPLVNADRPSCLIAITEVKAASAG